MSVRGRLAGAVTLALALAVAVVPAASAEDPPPCTPGVFLEAPPPALTMLQAAEANGVIDTANQPVKGQGIKVAVVDSGVALDGQHLTADNVMAGVDLVLGTTDARIDYNGHGTAIAGAIAARPVDGSVVVGIAPEASIIPIRVYTKDDKEGDASDPNAGAIDMRLVAQGIQQAADLGAHIINVSISSETDYAEVREAVEYAQSRGSLIVASAGNKNTAGNKNSTAPRYPAAYDGVLGVTATNQSSEFDESAAFPGWWVDVAALGQNVASVDPNGAECVFNRDAPSTSYATAYVSAAAALVAQMFPNEGPDYWAYRLMATASRSSLSERSDEFGWGIIRPYDALTDVDDGNWPGPANPVIARPDITELDQPPVDTNATSSPFEGTRDLAIVALAVALGAIVLLVLSSYRRTSRT